VTELLGDEDVNRRILEVVPGGIVMVSTEGAILTANGEACRVLGLTYDALTKRYLSDFAPDTLREDGTPMPVEEYPVTQALITGQQQPPKTVGVRHKDGTVTWSVYTALPVFREAKLTGVVVTFIDITAVRAAEAKQRASEARMRSIFESAPNIIVSTDLEGRIDFINRVVVSNSREEVIGRHAADFVIPEGRAVVEACFRRVRETGQISSYELPTRGNGHRYSVHVGPIKEGDELKGFTLVGWDISHQRELEARLVVSDRMASIGQLAAGVAHEINNPLTYVLANLHGLVRALDASNDDKARELAERAAQAVEGAERIKSIVRDLSTFSHTSQTTPVLLDVRPMIESSIRMAHNQLRYRARVVRQLDEVPPVLANDSRLGQVFLNLLVNAAQAIPEGHVDDHAVTVRTRTDAEGNVVVEVHDTGSGVAPELIERIFDPFVTTKAQGEGTGLGLYICKNVIDSLGGTLELTSKPGDTCFIVKLPAAEHVVHSRPHPSAAPAAPFVKRRVLVIDDEPQIRALAKEALASHDLTLAESGRAAIACMTEATFDVIVCDLVMPDLTGMDVYEHAEVNAPGELSKFVFMTGGAFTERARAFIAAHGISVLDKPFSSEKLAAVVAKANAKRRAG
jgi:PAS domain S-box-containing protein